MHSPRAASDDTVKQRLSSLLCELQTISNHAASRPLNPDPTWTIEHLLDELDVSVQNIKQQLNLESSKPDSPPNNKPDPSPAVPGPATRNVLAYREKVISTLELYDEHSDDDDSQDFSLDVSNDGVYTKDSPPRKGCENSTPLDNILSDLKISMASDILSDVSPRLEHSESASAINAQANTNGNQIQSTVVEAIYSVPDDPSLAEDDDDVQFYDALDDGVEHELASSNQTNVNHTISPDSSFRAPKWVGITNLFGDKEMSPIPSQTAFADPHEHANLDTSQNELKHVDSAATAFCENTSKEMAEETDANVALLVNEDESMPQENEKRGQLDQTSHSFELDRTVTAAASKNSFNNVGDVAYEPDSSISINHDSDGKVEESPSFVASKKPKSKRRIIDISSDEEDELKVPSAPADCCPQVHHLGSDTNTPCKESSAHSNQIYPLAVIPSTPPATETVQQEEPFFTPAGSFSPFKATTKKKVAVVIRRQSSLRHEITSAIKSGDLFDFLHPNTYASGAVENSSVQVSATVSKSMATQKSTTTVSGNKIDGTLQRQVYKSNDESDADEPLIRRTPWKTRRKIIEDFDDNEDEDVESSQGRPLDDTLIEAFNRSSINTQPKEEKFEDEESPFNPGVIVFDGGRKKPAAISSKNPRDPYHFSADESSASSVPRSKLLLSEVFSTPPTKVATPTKYFTPSQTSSSQVSKAKREFVRNRETITSQLYKEYNERIFKNQLPEKLDIIWSAKLNTTAGRTYTRRVKRGNGEWSYSASVELSTKVLDEIDKLRNTFIHELCHVAAWLIDKVNKPPHGSEFNKWGKIAMSVYPDITVSTCHSYDIDYKYKYTCTNENCGHVYGRHSKSIDITKKCCGYCGSKLMLPEKLKKDGTPYKNKGLNLFQTFLKENLKSYKQKYPDKSHQEVMSIVSQEYKKVKTNQHEQKPKLQSVLDSSTITNTTTTTVTETSTMKFHSELGWSLDEPIIL